MANVKYTLDTTQLQARLRRFPSKMPVAARDALNKTMAHGKAIATDDVSSIMQAKRNSVGKRINFFKATVTALSSAIILRGGRGLNLASFAGARATKKGGVKVTIFGELKQLPHAFIRKNIGETRTVFERYGNKDDKFEVTKGRYAGRLIKRGPRAGRPILRQPIESQVGPTVAETWEQTPGLDRNTQQAIQSELPKQLESQISRFTKE